MYPIFAALNKLMAVKLGSAAYHARRAEALMEDHLPAIEDMLSLVEPAALVDPARAFAGAGQR